MQQILTLLALDQRLRAWRLRAAFAMFQHIPTKERLRGRAVEALHFYQAMTVRPLVEALRVLNDALGLRDCTDKI